MTYVGIDVAKDKHECFTSKFKGSAECKHYNTALSHAAKNL